MTLKLLIRACGKQFGSLTRIEAMADDYEDIKAGEEAWMATNTDNSVCTYGKEEEHAVINLWKKLYENH